ncbi:MAG: PH domain-containing protein [Clostridiales bacterium]|nr:PH domain-containing protein [Clostridiales bacterium]
MFNAPKRNHFTIIFERLAAVIAFFATYFISELKRYGWKIFSFSFYVDLIKNAAGQGRKTELVFGVAVIFFIWILFISYRYWVKTVFYIEGTDFIYRRDTMFKMSSTLPIHNIAMVNVERNIFERLIGTAKVKIDLNSSRTASKTDFKFVLKRDEALALKAELLRIKESGVEEIIEGESAEPLTEEKHEPSEGAETLAYFTPREAFIHKLLTIPVFRTLFAVAVIVIPIVLADRADRDISGMWFLLVVAVIGFVGSIVSGTLNFGNYTVKHNDKMIYMSCGVLNKRNYSFEKEKVNAVMISQPFLARIFGKCSVNIAVVGLGNEKNETTHLALMTDKKTAVRIINECVPDFKSCKETERTSPVIFIGGVVRALIVGFISCIFLVIKSTSSASSPFLADYAYIIAAAVFVFFIFMSFLEYRAKTFGHDGDVVCYSSGMFGKYYYIIKYGDIQSVTVKTNILFKRSGLGRMKFSILSASAMQKHKTGWFKISDFDFVADTVVNTEDKMLL